MGPETAVTFTIARNPDADSTLPYLLRLPLPGGPLLLKAADTWPPTTKVYCHRADTWPDHPDIVEEVPVRSCQRRGVAIDLVLDRARENRSQIVFTTIRGREGIFWQSPRTTRRSRPGVRVPSRRAAGLDQVVILVDTIFRLDHVAPGFVADLLGAVQVRYPQIPIVFCDTRPLAEEWTYRFLGAALANLRAADNTP